MAEGHYSRVYIRVRAHTTIGQSVAVGGSSNQFGNFDKNRVIHLVTTPDSYPVWYSKEPIIMPRYQVSQYKYCTVEGGVVRSFERLDTVRTLSPDTIDFVLEDNFNPMRLESSAFDSEANLLQEMQRLTNTGSLDSSLHDSIHSVKDRDTSQRLFITCYHLPLKISRTDKPDSPFEVVWAESLIAKSEDSVSGEKETFWVGTLSIPDPAPSEAEMEILKKLVGAMNCIPVSVDQDQKDRAYHGYCKEVMWPIFHNVDQLDHIHAAWHVQKISKAKLQGGTGKRGIGVSIDSTSEDVAMSPFPSSSSSDKAEGEKLKWTKHEEKYFKAYKAVTALFDQKLSTLLQPQDVVWVHDYHLMLLPGMLRSRKIEGLRLCFFLHIPFPTSQIFRSIGSANELLQSMVSADIIGFHAFDHSRHFLNCAKRVMGVVSRTLAGGMIALDIQGREVIVTMSHVSIEPGQLDKALDSSDVLEMTREIRERHKGRKIVAGIDVCQRLSGGALKLAAFEKLLTDYSDSGSNVVLIQKSLRPRARLEDEETTSKDLTAMVEDLNGRFSRADGEFPVQYDEVSGMSLKERLALYLAADVFLLTSIREGLNLMPLEYIYARKSLPHAGVVICSEFSTCSSLLNGSLKINPFYALEVADSLDKALHLDADEADTRRARDMQFVKSHPSALWTKNILGDLKHLDGKRVKKKYASKRAAPEPVDKDYLLEAYETSRAVGLSLEGRRVFIFDYGGTLLHKEKHTIYIKQTLSAISGRKPQNGVMEAIRVLSEDPHNAVMVMTGLTRLKLGDTFKGLPNVTLVTSNGLVYSWGQNLLNERDKAKYAAFLKANASNERLSARVKQESPEFEQDFEGMNEFLQDDEGRIWSFMNFDIDWQAVCKIAVPIISKFTFRTNGTCLSPRIPGVGWSYFGADPDWGEKQASQLRIDLEAALANFDVKVASQIQGSIEIVPTMLTKGSMVEVFFEKLLAFRAGALPAFVFVMGDEESDDHMYSRLYELIGKSSAGSGVEDLKAFTINVGKRESTTASLFVKDVKAVEELLGELSKSTMKGTMHGTELGPRAAAGAGMDAAGSAALPPMTMDIAHVEMDD